MNLTRGERFKDARIVHNAKGKQTMDEVAAATGVSKSLIQALEDDSVNRSVGYDKVAKLANHYRVSANFLLGLSEDPGILPSAVDDLELSAKAVETIENLSMWDRPNERIQFMNGAGHALDVLNCLLESPYFHDVMGYLLMCFDSAWIHADAIEKNRVYMEPEFEAEIRSAGYTVLQGPDAVKLYANEACNSFRELICKEIPILIDSIKKK